MNKFLHHLTATIGTIIGMFVLAAVIFAVLPAVSVIIAFVVCAFVAWIMYILTSMYLAEGEEEDPPGS